MLGKLISRRLFSSHSIVGKVYPSAELATKDIHNGSTLCVGGFGLCGIPESLIAGETKKNYSHAFSRLVALCNASGTEIT